MGNRLFTTISSSFKNNSHSGIFFHSRYKYFQLEGIPPYPSYFIPVEFTFDVWLESTNGARFRTQKTFHTLGSEAKQGLVYLAVGDGLGNVWKAEIWDGKINEQFLQDVSHPKDYQEYEASEMQTATRFLEKAVSFIDRTSYEGIIADGQFGNVHLIRQYKGTFNGGTDMYKGWDHLREIKLRVDKPQILEDINWLNNISEDEKSQVILHSRYWQDTIEWIKSDNLPSNLLEPTFQIPDTETP